MHVRKATADAVSKAWNISNVFTRSGGLIGSYLSMKSKRF